MTADGLDYSIRKKLDTQYLRDMSQLADRVRQVEQLKAEKARANKNNRKDRIAYVELGNDKPETFGEQVDFNEGEIDLAELKQGPLYSCKFLTPSSGKNSIEPDKDARFPKKIYTFGVTKCDKIFDLLVIGGQMIVPPRAKILPLEQRKKEGFLDLVQSAIRDGRLQFGDKSKAPMRIDVDPLQIVDSHYTEPSMVNMVEISEDSGKKADMVEVFDDFK
ncbi:uncharacterized protein LOC127096981 [Lathyrus oleraceus]|uniref:uncharacterized protein LOC127096981 n=1 Tax=Pisum sativum TaxID=3888 RepID=UPI0021CFEC4C|nr:uncharacterized protein LOC127096981 [Pisum sativum]